MLRTMSYLLPALLLLSGFGCSAFRTAFDEDPVEAQRRRELREMRAKQNANREMETIPNLFGRKPDDRPSDFDRYLSPHEKDLLRASERESLLVDAEIEAIRKGNSSSSGSNHDFVFGSGVKDWL